LHPQPDTIAGFGDEEQLSGFARFQSCPPFARPKEALFARRQIHKAHLQISGQGSQVVAAHSHFFAIFLALHDQ
jgi:uncharacterized HAD superfamily protein